MTAQMTADLANLDLSRYSRVDPKMLKAVESMPEDDSRELRKLLTPRIVEPYFVHNPHPVQRFALCLNGKELLFGGAAGGGKSDWLLMAALQYVDVPHYSALILRKTWPDLNAPGAILDRAKTWFAGLPVKKSDEGRYWTFPSGATLQFGTLQYDKDVSKYMSAEYQFIGFDELTHWREEPYKFMFSRIRKPQVQCLTCSTALKRRRRRDGQVDFVHARMQDEKNCRKKYPDPRPLMQYKAAPDGTTLFDVPLRMRAACVDEGDVLTEFGWKRIQDVKVGERVYSVGRDGSMRLRPVLRVFAGKNDKGLVRVNKKNLRMSITPDHKIVRRKYGSADHDLIEFENAGKSVSVVRAPLSYDAGLGIAQSDSFLEFLGYWLADGCTTTRNRIIISKQEGELQRRMAKVLDELGVHWTYSHGDFTIIDSDMYEYLSQFGKSKDKFVPREILNTADARQLGILLDALIACDGHVRKNNCTYTTASEQLSDDVQEMFLKLGWKVSMSTDVFSNPNHADRINIYATKSKNNTTKVDKGDKRNDAEKISHSGNVYCIEVEEDHNFVIRQQGTIWISGNSNPGSIGHIWVRSRFVDEKTRDKNAMFIPSLISDNPSLNQEEYKQTLMHLSPVARERMLNGDWDVQEEGGLFDRDNFQFADEIKEPVIDTVRAWDMAASTRKSADFTVGAKVSIGKSGRWYIEDIVRGQWHPADCEARVYQTFQMDGKKVKVRMEQEPGSAGVNMISNYRRNVIPEANFDGIRPSGDKATRAGAFSTHVAAKNVTLIRGRWNSDFLDEAQLFPNGEHDDQIDAVVHAAEVILYGRRTRIIV